ncbi:MAG: ferric reductase-like transmembrane domain-containing protein [Acidimicrobiales bacterium]|jgi:sulfoxide reductase heme-binding subunit YedZ
MLATTSTTVWFTMRATGVVALVLLTGTMVLGIMAAGRTTSRSWPAFARADLHKWVSLLAMVFLALHVLTAVIDTYVDVGWLAIVVPFASHYRPLWTGLGTAGVDLMLAVALSSALRQRISARTWRGIHWLAYGSWPVAMAHSLGMGTDASTLWMDAIAGVCTLAVLVAVVWRVAEHNQSTRRAVGAGARTRKVSASAQGRRTRRQQPGVSSTPAPARVRTATRSTVDDRPTTAIRLLEKDRP